jgi:putative transcriptional regulator
MGEKKLRVADEARVVGVHRNEITLLYEQTATRVDINTIDKFCAFLDCGIQDLFEYIPESDS